MASLYSEALKKIDSSGINTPKLTIEQDHAVRQSLIKTPAFIIASEVNIKDGYTVCQAVCQAIGNEHVDMVQQVRNLWRIYLLSRDAKLELVTKGIVIEGKWCSVYNSNPYATGSIHNITTSSSSQGGNGPQKLVDNVRIKRVTMKVKGPWKTKHRFVP